MLRAAILAFLICLPSVSRSQDWTWVDGLLLNTLTNGQIAEAAYFFPNHSDPAQATQALAVAYVHIAGSAGNTSIAVGLYANNGGAWSLHRRVDNLFGHSPRQAELHINGVYITTDMLGPNDARCCPTAETRWFVDWNSGVATRLN